MNNWSSRTAALLAICCVMFLLSACSRAYVIRLNNGARITAASKPKLQNGTYIFEDASGRQAYVPASRVREIGPASMYKDDKNQFIPSNRN